MELTPLRYFLEVARTGHITRAAERLGMSQPALSSAIRKLEDEAGAPLLDRTAKGVELTEAGRVFAEHARESLQAADDGVRAVRELVGLESGLIRIGGGATAVGYLLPPAISAFRAQHPAIRYYIREAGSGAVGEAVLAGELDLGIVTLPVRVPGVGDLLTLPLVTDELRLIVPAEHRLADRKNFRWSDLEGEAMVGFEAGSAVREVIDREARAHGAELRVVMELRSIEPMRHMVEAGVGVAFVSRFALQSADEGLGCLDGKLTRELAIVRRADRVPSAAVAAFERVLGRVSRR